MEEASGSRSAGRGRNSRRVLSYSAFVLAQAVGVLVTLVAFGQAEFFNRCFLDRFDPETKKQFSALWGSPRLLIFLTNALAALYVLQLVSWVDSKKKTKRKRRTFVDEVLFGILFHTVWWFSTYCGVVIVKVLLQDTRCNVKPNSVSGHFAFFTFLLLGIPYQTVRLTRDPRRLGNYLSRRVLSRTLSRQVRWRSLLFALNYAAIVAVACAVLFRTLVYGFHTLRQVFLGIFISTLSHFIFVLVFNNVAMRVISESLEDLHVAQLVVLFAFEAGASVLLLLFAGPSLNLLEMAMNVVMLILLLAWAMYRIAPTRARRDEENSAASVVDAGYREHGPD